MKEVQVGVGCKVEWVQQNGIRRIFCWRDQSENINIKIRNVMIILINIVIVPLWRFTM